MINKVAVKNERRERRKKRVRKSIFGLPSRPRVSIYKSNKYIYAQAIDDINGRTIVSVSSISREFDKKLGDTVEDAKILGDLMAKKLLEKGIDKIVFDRNFYKYHGVVKTFADAMREGGIKF
ncbi:MAG: 50S ribosomal protein L18 [Brevinematales bacterium]|nr:50S ribosomal protein L18 [Brevinematales bacterium]